MRPHKIATLLLAVVVAGILAMLGVLATAVTLEVRRPARPPLPDLAPTHESLDRLPLAACLHELDICRAREPSPVQDEIDRKSAPWARGQR